MPEQGLSQCGGKISLLLQNFDARHSVYRTTTPHYQQQQRRLLQCLGDDSNIAMAQLQAMNVRQGTKTSYWASYLAAKKIAGAAPTPLEARLLKNLSKSARMEKQIHSAPMTQLQLANILSDPFLDPEVRLLIGVTWATAQRISDVEQWQAEDVRQAPTSVVVTVRFGKTAPTTGPYTLFIPTEPFGIALLTLAASRSPGTLFRVNRDLVTAAIKRGGPALERRSIRRGGACHMAASGVQLQQIMDFTRHKSEDMLFRYIEYGAVSSAREKMMTSILTTTTSNLPSSLHAISQPPTRYVATRKKRRQRNHYTSTMFPVKISQPGES